MTDFAEFFLPTRIRVGADVAKDLEGLFAERGVRQLLVISDRGVEKAGILRIVLADLGGQIEILAPFLDVPADSDIDLIDRLAADLRAREAGGQSIGLLAVGGGSVIDTAKGVNLVRTLGGSIRDYQGYGVIDRPLGPFIAIPTTAGTGSEVTPFAVVKDGREKTKITFVSPYLAPQVALLIPPLTYSLPLSLTVETAMDALTHAIEAYLSNDHNAFADALAVGAMKMIASELPVLVGLLKAGNEEGVKSARTKLLVASTMAGMAFSSALVGCVHALAHALGGLYGVPHGLANGVLLAPGLRFNLRAATQRLAEVGEALGADRAGDSIDSKALAAIEFIEDLSGRLGLPRRLRDLGIPRESLGEIAQAAVQDGAMFTNPRQAEAEEIQAMLEEIY
ncbi:MAG: iron-containing alcohol dehydrogenase [Firmicutes bacterium]|nr:iron-containing alcohol dehydrogenase [Bacillota bacterium]